jgi:hypothetical protein
MTPQEETVARATYQAVQREHLRIAGKIKFPRVWLQLTAEEQRAWFNVAREAIAAGTILNEATED